MVSKASEDLPEPDGPVTTVMARRGISRSNPLRLCWSAPRTVMCDFMSSSRASGERSIGAQEGDRADAREDETPERESGIDASGEQVAEPAADERADLARTHREELTAAIFARHERDGYSARYNADQVPDHNAHDDSFCNASMTIF